MARTSGAAEGRSDWSLVKDWFAHFFRKPKEE
jgi:hypothetical protein